MQTFQELAYPHLQDAPAAIAHNLTAVELWQGISELSGLSPYDSLLKGQFDEVIGDWPVQEMAESPVPGYTFLVMRPDLLEGRSYKLHGATSNLLLGRQRKPKARRVVAASTGNHGIETTIAAQALEFDGVVVMLPEDTSEAKKEWLRHLGADVRDQFTNLPLALKAARREGARTDTIFVHPYNAYDTLVGQGTIVSRALRYLRAQGKIDLENAVVTHVEPGGGGGVGASNAVSAKALLPHVRNYIAQMKGAEGIVAALENRPFQITDFSCDGAAVAEPGELPMKIIRDRLIVDGLVVVTKGATGQAMRLLAAEDSAGEPPEPAGATALAAAIQMARRHPIPAGDTRQRIMIVNRSGSNLTAGKYADFTQAADAQAQHQASCDWRENTALTDADYQDIRAFVRDRSLQTCGAISLTQCMDGRHTPSRGNALSSQFIRS